MYIETDHWSVGSSKMFTIYCLFVHHVLQLLANIGMKVGRLLDSNLNVILDLRSTVIEPMQHGKIKNRTRRTC